MKKRIFGAGLGVFLLMLLFSVFFVEKVHAKKEMQLLFSEEHLVAELPDEDGRMRHYFNEGITLTLTVSDQDEIQMEPVIKIIRTDAAGKELPVSGVSKGEFKASGVGKEMTLSFTEEGNYALYAYVRTVSGETISLIEPYLFTLDQTAPEIRNLTCDAPVSRRINQVDTSFYADSFLMQFQVMDDISGLLDYQIHLNVKDGDSFSYEEVSSEKLADGNGYEICVSVSGEFEGVPEIEVRNKCSEVSKRSVNTHLVLDKTLPKVELILDASSGENEGTYFYKEKMAARLNICERYFYEEDVKLTLTRNGKEVPISLGFDLLEEDMYSAEIPVLSEGNYLLTVDYMDPSGHQIETLKSNPFILDFSLMEPVIQCTDGMISVTAEDENLSSASVRLLQGSAFETKDHLKEMKKHTEEGKVTYTYQIPETEEADGIYQIFAEVTDFAGNKRISEQYFTVHDAGAIFLYDEAISTILQKENGYLNQEKREFLSSGFVIKEFSPVALTDGKGVLSITRDKELIDAKYTVTEIPGEKKTDWYQYVYTVSPENFLEDGTYKLVVTSEASDGLLSQNVPERTVQNDFSKMQEPFIFTVDEKPPVLMSILGLKHKAISDGKLEVPFWVQDIYGLSEVSVYLDDNRVLHETEFSGETDYEGKFELTKTGEKQHIRIVIVDRAQNVYDSDLLSKKELTFQTDVFVGAGFFRMFMDRKGWLFFITIPGSVLLILFSNRKRRGKDHETEKEK